MANEAVERFKELFAEAHEADDCHQVLQCDPRTIIELETELRHLETELAHTRASLTADEGVGWRPIETAPKDGTTVLVYAPKGFEDTWAYYDVNGFPTKVVMARWHKEAWGSAEPRWITPFITVETFGGSEYTGTWTETESVVVRPTHWMPLPEPPE